MGPRASAVPGDEPSGVAVAPSLGSSEHSRSRISNCPSPPRTGAPAASHGASQKASGPRPATRAALCQGVQSPGPNAGRAAALPAPWARAYPGWVSRRTRLFTLEGRLLLSPGGDRLRTTAARGCGQGGACSSEAPHRAEPRRLALLGVLRRVFPRSDTAARPGPSESRQSFFLHRGRRSLPGSLGTSAQSPKRQAYRGAGAGGMVGAPGLSGRADHKLCGNVRPKLERGGRGPGAAAACPARSRGSQRPGAGRRRWRLRWPAPCRHHPSGSARNSVQGPPLPWLAGRDAWSVAARDGPGGQLWQGRGWLRSTAAT